MTGIEREGILSGPVCHRRVRTIPAHMPLRVTRSLGGHYHHLSRVQQVPSCLASTNISGSSRSWPT